MTDERKHPDEGITDLPVLDADDASAVKGGTDTTPTFGTAADTTKTATKNANAVNAFIRG